MQVFECPAAYRRLVESSLAILLAEIGRDVARREDDDPRVRGFATVPDAFVDAVAGRVIILVGVPDAVHETSAVTEILAAAQPILRSA